MSGYMAKSVEIEERTTGIIELDGAYAVLVMNVDYALAKVGVHKKTGKTTYSSIGYYGTVSQCLRAYIRESVHDELGSKAKVSVKEAEELIVDAVRRCESAIRGAFPEYKVVRA